MTLAFFHHLFTSFSPGMPSLIRRFSQLCRKRAWSLPTLYKGQMFRLPALRCWCFESRASPFAAMSKIKTILVYKLLMFNHPWLSRSSLVSHKWRGMPCFLAIVGPKVLTIRCLAFICNYSCFSVNTIPLFLRGHPLISSHSHMSTN